MAISSRRAKRPELKVVFDTNAIFSGSASDLLRQEVRSIIQESSKHSDLVISWCLPDMVVHERQFQMRRKGLELLPSIQKLEVLLGHGLGITEDIIETRIKEAVSKQIEEHGLKIRQLTTSDVQWERLIQDAVYRRPPFEPGDREKGFRDALIAETFLQIVAESPSTPRVCRIALVTEDKLLTEAVTARTAGRANVRILGSLDELKGLINTLVAEVDEEFISKIRERAAALFFTKGDNESLYYKEKISLRIKEQSTKELSALPAGATRRQEGTWFISKPEFVKKDRQRVTWVSRISAEAKAIRFEMQPQGLSSLSTGILGTPSPTGGGNVVVPTVLPSTMRAEPLFPPESLGSILGANVMSTYGPIAIPMPMPVEHTVATGKSIFEVVWSVSVSTSGRFSKPRIETIKFVETVWNTQ